MADTDRKEVTSLPLQYGENSRQDSGLEQAIDEHAAHVEQLAFTKLIFKDSFGGWNVYTT